MLDKDYLVYLVTGRPEYFSNKIANSIDSRIKTISYNGAVYEYKDIRIVKSFSKEHVEEILEIFERFNFRTYFKTEDKIYTNDQRNLFDYSSLGIETIYSLESLPKEKIIKIIVLEDSSRPSEFSELIERLEIDYNLFYYKGKGLELSTINASKGIALKNIIDYYHLSKNDVYVFGDDMNDLSMFDESNNAVASANASDFVRMHAYFVSTDNNHSCVAHGLRHFGLFD